MDEVVYKIKGLHCSDEVRALRNALEKKSGIQELSFSLVQAKMIVMFDPTLVSAEQIEKEVHSLGMRAILWGSEESLPLWKKHLKGLATLGSGLFLLTALLLRWQGVKGAEAFYLASIVCGVVSVVPKAIFAASRLRPDMNLLMVVAILGAIGIGEWFEAASVAFLFSLALLLEQMSVARAQRAIGSLVELAPEIARIRDPSGNEIELPVEEVEKGCLMVIRPGEKIPLDGTVLEGRSGVDQSLITGESMPLAKEPGDELYAGTLNQDGFIVASVTRVADETTLSKIIHLVEEARAKQSRSEQWVEKFARIYTPVMILLALLVMSVPPLALGLAWGDWIYRALVLLVIACPCALVISTPVSIVSGLTAAANRGILIKGGVYLELVGRIQALALDKTGTLTYGHPEVQSVVPMNQHTPRELLERAVSLEAKSVHPLARAIREYAKKRDVAPVKVDSYRIIEGRGAEGVVYGKPFWIGSHRLMHEQGQETKVIHEKALELEDAGHSIVAIGTSDHVCGLISIADEPRLGIDKTLEEIESLGVKPIVMLTGDNHPTATALAKAVGLKQFQSELLPQDKVQAIVELKKRGIVAMCGDGINDAPALAAADVGIAMAGMGTDVAIETADIALMSDEIERLPWLIRHSRRVVRLVQQNVVFALSIKLLFIALALFDVTTLWMAIAADTGATLLVIANALRLLKSR